MPQDKKVLIVDEMHESIVSMLNDIGFEPDYQPTINTNGITEADDQYVGIIIRSKASVNEVLIGDKHKLRFIARAGAGIDNLDVNYLEKRGIEILNAPEGNRDALGEHVLGMLLNLSNNLRQADNQIRNMVWDREVNRGFEIKNKVIGLLGYGFMGSAVAEKISGLGCKVLAYDKYKTGFSDDHVKEVTLEDIFELADIFSVHVPLTTETRGMINGDFFSRFSKKITFINSARGEVTVIADLLDALRYGKVKHAALDVLENEKFNKLTISQREIYKVLFKLPNVLFSPHVAGWSFESYRNINRVLVDKISKLRI